MSPKTLVGLSHLLQVPLCGLGFLTKWGLVFKSKINILCKKQRPVSSLCHEAPIAKAQGHKGGYSIWKLGGSTFRNSKSVYWIDTEKQMRVLSPIGVNCCAEWIQIFPSSQASETF